MFLGATSIRGKIATGYVVSFLFLLAFASVLFVSLHVAEDEVEFYFGTSRFLDATLEMRRYEKNYLLYGQLDDLESATRFADSAGALVAGRARAPRHPRWMRLFADQDGEAGAEGASPQRTIELLREYAALLRHAGEAKAAGDARRALAVEADLRDLGRRITGIAERLSAAEGRNIQQMLRSGRRTLILLVALFLVGTAIVARLVRSTAIRPLQELEAQVRRLASGDYQLAPEGPGADEINALNRAFNRMIREIFEHRQQKIQSERLAALGTMLAGIAHEINNPLSNVSTSAEILKEENERAGPVERRELIDQIVSQTDRATDIIRTVLDFSREGERRSTNLLSAVRGSMILVRGEVPAHVSVDVDVPPDLEIPADKTKLEQAFINLITNSIDAMSDAGRESRIAISARPAGDRDVEIVFRDTGAGIPANLLDRVFDPFFTTKDVGQGTGLGLYLTHHIVEQHGGTIRVESAVGRGTAFFITLPRGGAGPAAPGPGPRRGGERVNHGR